MNVKKHYQIERRKLFNERKALREKLENGVATARECMALHDALADVRKRISALNEEYIQASKTHKKPKLTKMKKIIYRVARTSFKQALAYQNEQR